MIEIKKDAKKEILLKFYRGNINYNFVLESYDIALNHILHKKNSDKTLELHGEYTVFVNNLRLMNNKLLSLTTHDRQVVVERGKVTLQHKL